MQTQGYIFRDGIYHLSSEGQAWSTIQTDVSEQYDAWARQDIVHATTARKGLGRKDYTTLVSPNVRLWKEHFPEGRKVGTVLEMGCGFGRIPLYLSTEKGFTCSTYYGVDISETMLLTLQRYREQFGFLPGARVVLFRQPAENRLPLEDTSVDVVISCALYNHLRKQDVAKSLGEIGRVLKPGGVIFLDRSFANSWSTSSWHMALGRGRIPINLKPYRTRFFSRSEVVKVLRESGITAKCPSMVVRPAGYALLPTKVKWFSVPFAQRLNQWIDSKHPPGWMQRFVTTHYVLSSEISGQPGDAISPGRS
ncbi:MAG: class I SAM-dependent methyltransferase [Dehalococcoidia bacterium]|nr:class I SAM-dependent methyltransferase [Dehalococcoidia bacterium]